MSNVFNTVFENSLRILLLLSFDNRAKTKDMISILDFITIYNKTLGIGDVDLHGENPFAFCEYTARREIINVSIKELVKRDLISIVRQSKGFCYKINTNGKTFIANLTTSYSKNYLISLNNTIQFSQGKNEQKLIAFINEKANKVGRIYE